MVFVPNISALQNLLLKIDINSPGPAQHGHAGLPDRVVQWCFSHYLHTKIKSKSQTWSKENMIYIPLKNPKAIPKISRWGSLVWMLFNAFDLDLIIFFSSVSHDCLILVRFSPTYNEPLQSHASWKMAILVSSAHCNSRRLKVHTDFLCCERISHESQKLCLAACRFQWLENKLLR